MTALLEVRGLVKRFGGVLSVDEVSFELDAGGILGLIGPNGSGKTTLLNTLNGVHRPDAGEIRLQGVPTTGLRPHQLSARGVMRTFQNARVFRSVSVYRNMFVPMLFHRGGGHGLAERAHRLLDFVGLGRFADLAASELSGGQQKLLEFARALMPEPKLILMDEPFAGVHPELKTVMVDRIRDVQAQGTAFVVVSHEIPLLMGLSERVMCLYHGKVIAAGEPSAVAQDPAVIEAYLGSAQWSH